MSLFFCTLKSVLLFNDSGIKFSINDLQEFDDLVGTKSEQIKNTIKMLEQVKFRPAKLITSKSGWRIVFYALSPYTNKLERITYKVNQRRKDYFTDKIAKQEFEKQVIIINARLLDGWSPFVATTNSNSIKSLKSAVSDFMRHKEKELRPQSFVHYKGIVSVFMQYFDMIHLFDVSISSITKYNSVAFMDYLSNKGVNAVTFNNYRTICRYMWSWFVERGYCAVNVFEHLKPRRTEKKRRTIIDEVDMARIIHHVKEYHPDFYVFMMLEYACLMRPIEIFRSKICNYDLDKQFIRLDGHQTKNGKPRNIVIPKNIIEPLSRHIHEVSQSSLTEDSRYLFSEHFKPGLQEKLTSYAGNYWRKYVKQELNLPDNYHLYSLRDTSIMNMLLSGISPRVVQKHADHSSLVITSTYANHETDQMNEDLRNSNIDF